MRGLLEGAEGRKRGLCEDVAIWYNVQRRPPSSKVAAQAGVTQLVEFLPSKQAVAGSSPVSRSKVHRFLINLCNLKL